MHFGSETNGLNNEVVLISSGLNSGTLLYMYHIKYENKQTISELSVT